MIPIVCAELCVESQGVLLLLLPKEASSCSLACSMRALWPEDGLLPLLPLPELRLRCAPCSALLCCRAASVRAAALQDACMHWLRGEAADLIDEKGRPFHASDISKAYACVKHSAVGVKLTYAVRRH